MQAVVSTRVAAAVLLSPLAVLLASPALADHREAYVAAPVYSQAPAAVYVQPQDYNRGWRRDERAPRIVDLTPEPGEFVGDARRVRIGARFHDGFSGVDPASVRLRVDGRDVTAAARIGEDQVRFRDELRPGRHYAEVLVRDRAGNLARRAWQFDVQPEERHGWRGGYDGYAAGRDGYAWGQEGWRR